MSDTEICLTRQRCSTALYKCENCGTSSKFNWGFYHENVGMRQYGSVIQAVAGEICIACGHKKPYSAHAAAKDGA